ncbi:MAG TPA: tetratricopeptide repeat protein [Caulobacter sp.]|nr:tetratricopeptide repeat protein [Caulobacter sp.]
MLKLVAKGPRISILAVCALTIGASAALAQTRPAAPSLDSISTEASRYAILSDALWAMGSEDLPERLDTARAAVDAKPDSAEAHLRLGLAISLENPRSVALIKGEYETALRLDPTMLRAYALMGELLSNEGDDAGVERNYGAWLALAPDDPKAHLSHAVALARLGRGPEAKAELERSLALGPTSAAYLSRAMASREGPREAILADLDKALAVGGGEARIYRWRARMRWEWRETDLALADVAKALEYAPDSFRLRQLRGEINSDAGRYDLALAEFDALIALQPGWPDLVNDRCWARAMAGTDLAKALADCDAVLGWEPERLEALDSRGLVKLRLGDLRGSMADYDAALKQDPEIATSLFGRGVAKHWSGDHAGGDADLDKARALEPEIDKRFAGFGVTP